MRARTRATRPVASDGEQLDGDEHFRSQRARCAQSPRFNERWGERLETIANDRFLWKICLLPR